MNWDNGHMDYYGHMDNGWGIAMVLAMLGFWALVILVVAWFIHSTRAHRAALPTPAAGTAASSAESILAERLARGEIDPEEYQARRRALNQSS